MLILNDFMLVLFMAFGLSCETMMTPKQLRVLLRYDPSTGNLVWKPRKLESFKDERSFKIWHTRYSGKPALITVARDGYRHGTISGRTYSTHRVVWAVCFGEWPKNEIDHINGDKLDNRLENLRDVTRGQNSRNLKLGKSNKSGCVGVFWCKTHRRWIATIGRNARLGYFKNFKDAVAARKEAEITHGYHPNYGRSI